MFRNPLELAAIALADLVTRNGLKNGILLSVETARKNDGGPFATRING